MKQLLNTLSRVWKFLKVLGLLKAAWEFIRDHWDDIF